MAIKSCINRRFGSGQALSGSYSRAFGTGREGDIKLPVQAGSHQHNQHGSGKLSAAVFFFGMDRDDPRPAKVAGASRRESAHGQGDKIFTDGITPLLRFIQMGGEGCGVGGVECGDEGIAYRASGEKEGVYAGSWDPRAENRGWGRVGQTAIGCLMLEVYYRYGTVGKHK